MAVRSFPAGVDQNDVVGEPGHRAGALVRDSDGEGPALASVFEKDVGVGGFPGLGDADQQRVVELQVALIQRADRQRGQRNGDARGDFNEVAAETRGVVRGAAGGEHHQSRRLRLKALPQTVKAAQFSAQRPIQRIRLLPDLFKHFRHGRETLSLYGKPGA